MPILWIFLTIIWLANFTLRLTILRGSKGNGLQIGICCLWIFFVCPLNIAIACHNSHSSSNGEMEQAGVNVEDTKEENSHSYGDYMYVYE